MEESSLLLVMTTPPGVGEKGRWLGKPGGGIDLSDRDGDLLSARMAKTGMAMTEMAYDIKEELFGGWKGSFQC
jgi:hypothetical protein